MAQHTLNLYHPSPLPSNPLWDSLTTHHLSQIEWTTHPGEGSPKAGSMGPAVHWFQHTFSSLLALKIGAQTPESPKTTDKPRVTWHRDAQQSQICVSNAFSTWCSINHKLTHAWCCKHRIQAALLQHSSGRMGKRGIKSSTFSTLQFLGCFFFQIDHKSTFKNSKPAFLLLVPLLSFDFFLILSFLYVCAWLFFFSFYMGKIRRQYYSALKFLCYYRFFFPWNQT